MRASQWRIHEKDRDTNMTYMRAILWRLYEMESDYNLAQRWVGTRHWRLHEKDSIDECRLLASKWEGQWYQKWARPTVARDVRVHGGADTQTSWKRLNESSWKWVSRAKQWTCLVIYFCWLLGLSMPHWGKSLTNRHLGNSYSANREPLSPFLDQLLDGRICLANSKTVHCVHVRVHILYILRHAFCIGILVNSLLLNQTPNVVTLSL